MKRIAVASRFVVTVATLLLAAGSADTLIAQSTGLPVPQFDVASIKPTSSPNTSGGGPLDEVDSALQRSIAQGSSHGSFQVPSASLHLLIQLAYNVRDEQIVGEPSWAKSELFEVTAKTERNVSFEQMRPMLRSLLAERFDLKLHEDTRELPVYELTAAKGGIKIIPATDRSCVKPDPNQPPTPFAKGCGGIRQMALQPGIYRFEGFGVSMSKLVEMLANHIGSKIVDKTGFSDAFNFQLDFSQEDARTPNPAPPMAAESDKGPIAPALFTALREQLGLKLERAKGSAEVLVIDHAKHPSPN